MDLKTLRKKHPSFIYQNFSYRVKKDNLEIVFDFLLEPDIRFFPKITIKRIDKKRLEKIGQGILENFIFHLGLIEIPSYWKAAAPAKIIIKPGFLNKKQLNWWKNLIIKGMGQFFYENRIDWRKKDFLKIVSQGKKTYPVFVKELKNRYLASFSGGKDSIVALELLKKQKKKVNLFLLNPSRFAKKALKATGIKNPIIAQRTIDPLLIKLNKKGYLNGHTPFTGLLSFLAVFSGILFDYKNIAFSNEKSANEGNLKYMGKIVNHQWSKSSEFEKSFREYALEFLAKKINYFSFLRNFGELEISKMFLRYPKYFSSFTSCNKAQKTGKRWCGNCPKCLFVYSSFYPFLKEKELLKIFGQDIFENKKLLPVLKKLFKKELSKPFECVGTKKEAKKALLLSLKKAKKSGKIPYLLKRIEKDLLLSSPSA